MSNAPDNAKRYFARAWEDETNIPTSNPDTNHQPLHALIALLLAYHLLAATTRLKTSLLDTILLRSFPRWAEKYTVLQHTPLHPWLRPWCLNAVVGIAVAVGWRVWMGEGTRLWVVVARVTPGWMLGEMGVVGVLWGVEQFLRWTYKAGKAVGWVPCDEVEEAWARLSVVGKGKGVFSGSPDSQDSPMLDSNILSPGDDETSVQQSPVNSSSGFEPSSYDQPTPSIPPSRLSEYDRFYKFLTSPFQGAKIEESTGTMTYHSITIEKKYQNKSFEELRVQHYRDVHGSEHDDVREEEQSFLGRSWSFLTDSLFGGESLGSRDSFGRSTAVVRDSMRVGGGARIAEGRGEVPDLLTGTPRRLFT